MRTSHARLRPRHGHRDPALATVRSRKRAPSPRAVQVTEPGYGRPIEAGTIIFLNGTSSSGKGTLARALQASLDSMFLHVEMDYIYGAMEAAGYNGAVGKGENVPPKLAQGAAFIHDDWRFVRIEYGDDGRRAFQGFFAMTAALAESGTNLIVDGFLDEAWMIPSAAASLGSQRAFLVGLHCDLDELERRERERGDRFPGIARAFAEAVHQHVPFYDIEIDTGTMSVEESVREIMQGISIVQPQTFRSLQQGSSGKHSSDR